MEVVIPLSYRRFRVVFHVQNGPPINGYSGGGLDKELVMLVAAVEAVLTAVMVVMVVVELVVPVAVVAVMRMMLTGGGSDTVA